MSPDVLTDGTWQPDKRGVLRWVDATPAAETVIAIALLIACPSCHAKVDETCRSAGGRSDGGRPRRHPHRARLAPRLCRCGALLQSRRQLCDACRDELNRANKAAYMARWRARQRCPFPLDTRRSPCGMPAEVDGYCAEHASEAAA